MARLLAKVGGCSALCICNRPRWEDVYNGYPWKSKDASTEIDEDAVTVFKDILGGKYDQRTRIYKDADGKGISFENACATRVSLALVKSRMEVRNDFMIQTGNFKGKGFIASAKGLKDWLSEPDVWGKADLIIEGKSTLEEVREKIHGRSGVYIILDGENNKKDHATLWVGAKKDVVGANNYIDDGGTVYFWELNKSTTTETEKLFIVKVVGNEEAVPGQKVEYKAICHNNDGNEVSPKDLNNVKWEITIDGQSGKLENKTGETITFGVKAAWMGKEIVVMPYLNEKPSKNMCQRTTVKALVIDRYKMPGLNPEGTDIAEDMCYGLGIKKDGEIYSRAIVNQYKKEYEENGFDSDFHALFSNANSLPKTKYKAIYSEDDCRGTTYKNKLAFYTGSDIRSFVGVKDDDLFSEFKTMAKFCFANRIINYIETEKIADDISNMINKMWRKEGGIYESNTLTVAIIKDPATTRYCQKINEYIAKKLNVTSGILNDLKDAKPYFIQDFKGPDGKKVLSRRDANSKSGFTRPMYNSTKNKTNGLSFTIHDVWSSEVAITNYELEGEEYEVKYRVILWDHFGLNKSDMEALHNIVPIARKVFTRWFILQHLRGYKPFITKLAFTCTAEGNFHTMKTNIKDLTPETHIKN